MTTRVFDRIPYKDPRSLEYPIRSLVADRKRRGYTWSVPVKLDQGDEGACVGFGWAHEIAARPWGDSDIDDTYAFSLYHAAQAFDREMGNHWPEGASVLAGAKAAVQIGKIQEYRWALGPGAQSAENDLALAVGYKGPAVLGTYWFAGMDEPDENGFLRPTGAVRGGHCYIAYGYDYRKSAYKIWNSWGTGHYGLISAGDMITLLDMDGEACIPIVRNW